MTLKLMDYLAKKLRQFPEPDTDEFKAIFNNADKEPAVAYELGRFDALTTLLADLVKGEIES